MAGLEIQLFGFPSSRLDGRAVELPLRKGLALLAYLADARGQVARDQMATLLWPDSDTEAARGRLRRTLHRVRVAFAADVIDADRTSLWLAPTFEPAVDTHAFEAACAGGELDQAVQLYGGDFLDGLSLKGCAAFDEWAFFRREALRSRLVQALERLIERELARGEPRAAIAAATRLVGLDPLSESAQRHLIGAYLRAGDRAAAERQYEACMRLLRTELDAAPDPQTQALIAAAPAQVPLRPAAELLREVTAPTVPQDIPSVAVLPFVTNRLDSQQVSFADGICEDIITALSSISRLLVIGRSSSFAYRGQDVDAKRAGRELGVAHILEGSVRKSGTHVRISAQLIDAATGVHVWAHRYDRHVSDAFAVQEEITQEIVTALAVKLTEGEQVRGWRRDAVSPEAYQFFARGREASMTFTRGGMVRARDNLERAIRINPDFATATAYIGFIHAEEARFQWSASRQESLARARDAGNRALALNASCAIAHSLLGYVAMVDRDFEQAVSETARAITVQPSAGDAYHVHAMARIYNSEFAEGVRLEQRSLRLNPLALENSLVDLARAYFHLDRFDDAIDFLERARRARPYWLTVLTLQAASYYEIGRLETAKRTVGEIMRLKPDFSIARWASSQLYRRREELERYLCGLRKVSLPE